MTKKRYPRLLGLLPLFGTLLLGGCNMTLLDPVGQVGIEERNLIITATLLTASSCNVILVRILSRTF